MAIGRSGRVVLEVDPALKKKLYAALAMEQRSLKDWFVAAAEEYLTDQTQPGLFKKAETSS